MKKPKKSSRNWNHFNLLPVGIIILQDDFTILFWNSCIEAWTGIPAREITGKKITERFEPLNKPFYRLRIEEIFSGGPAAIFSSQFHPHFIPAPLPQGGFRVQNVSVIPFVAGKNLHAMIVIEDVTDLVHQVQAFREMKNVAENELQERKKAEDALRESEERYSGFFRTSGECVFITSKDGHWIDLNDAAVDLFGYKSREELMQVRVPDLYADPEDRKRHIRAVEEHGFTKEYPVDLRRKDGRVMHTLVTSVARYDADGRVIGFQGTVRDITDRKQAEDALRLANNKLNLLSSITRHDILNQVTALLAYLELTKEHVSDPVARSFVIKEIQVTGKIRDMIEFTRDYQSLGVKSPTWQNVYEVCVRILPLTDMISVDLPPSDLEIFADPLLEKVFYTLYDNAVRHGEHVTGMSIRCHEKEAQLTIVVEDNGAGVAPDMKGKIFQRGVGKHTGLGLFLARQILSLTGITIEETGEPGKGARFEIHVPAGVYRYIRAQ